MNLSRRNARNDEPEINVTNFIDVLLLLLIFFMLATTFVDEGRINMRLPDASVKVDAAAQRPTLEVGVSASGVYSVNGKELINTSMDTLSSAISKVAGDDRTQTVLIRADARSTHQSVVTAMDVLGRLGFRSISIATVNQPVSAGSK
ncbi:MAG TPA: biopolymer transporter ExbD [Steroidobacteraceae bacterium]|nr:biopolymer transporter ExbD [Steroidobacteraceae bacterium]